MKVTFTVSLCSVTGLLFLIKRWKLSSPCFAISCYLLTLTKTGRQAEQENINPRVQKARDANCEGGRVVHQREAAMGQMFIMTGYPPEPISPQKDTDTQWHTYQQTLPHLQPSPTSTKISLRTLFSNNLEAQIFQFPTIQLLLGINGCEKPLRSLFSISF